MITLNNIRLNIGEDNDVLLQKCCKKANVSVEKIKYFKILKKSLDARKKNDIHYVCSVEFAFSSPKNCEQKTDSYNYPQETVVVVGSGPAGLFCSLILARQGFKPLVIERGSSVDDRKAEIDKFIKTRVLNTECNIQFGEGGAGTFSDGKLNTGVKSLDKAFVLDEFFKHGANEDVTYLNKPHIGSDVLPIVVKNIREEIISLGGEFVFDACFDDLTIEDNKVINVVYTKKGKKTVVSVAELVVAIGHSARDTYKMLFDKGLSMEKKDMAIGFRVEHLQASINEAQYGKNYDKRLPVADYKLTSSVGERGVFTFCMCPGGFVMPATSNNGAVVTNGMSNYLREGKNANSAVVVQVKKEDYGEHVLSGIDFVEDLEKRAFLLGGSDYSAPCQLLGDFIEGRPSKTFGRVKPTYPLGVKFVDLNELLPQYLSTPIKMAFLDMEKRLNGFADKDAVLTAIETRTSSPVRIIRGENYSSLTVENLYPSGEVGYAGGIMSSALDGISVARAIMKKYKKNTD